MHDESITYTALTPNPLSQEVFRALGFTPLVEHRIIMPPLLHAETLWAPRPVISFDPEIVRQSLDDGQKRIFDDHSPYDCLQLVLQAGSEQAYMVVRRGAMYLHRLHRWVPHWVKLPYSEILYCSAPSLLTRYLEYIKAVLGSV
jgi:acetoacetyl-CoA synthetase